MDRFFGCWKWARELRQKIMKETHLPISFGLSVNKTVSKIATGEAKPCGEKEVGNGTEKIFLAPLSIRKIPMVGPKCYLQLRNMGISKICTLQEMDPSVMQQVMEKNGGAIWKKANGIDNTPVLPYSEQKSMSKEETFEQDTIDVVRLKKVLAKMVDELAFDLRKEGRVTGCVTLKIRYSNFETFSKQAKIAYTCSDKLLLHKVMDLFQKLYSRRMLIRLIGVKLSDLVDGSYQIDLFNDVVEDLNLMQAVDGIRMRFGVEKIHRCVCF
jgi:DNA polymerase-4